MSMEDDKFFIKLKVWVNLLQEYSAESIQQRMFDLLTRLQSSSGFSFFIIAPISKTIYSKIATISNNKTPR